MGASQIDRRFFLARVGVLGALATASTSVPGMAQALAPPGPSSASLVDLAAKLLAALARDTLNGLTVFVVPGPDSYSLRQGTPRSEPGALEARATDFLIESLDNYVPLPDQVAAPLGRALSGGLADVPLSLPSSLLSLTDTLLGQLDDVVRLLLRNDETLPLSAVIALLLNAQAVRVDPTSVSGPFLSPFSRLTFAKKAAVFELLEQADPELVAAVDAQLPEPLRGTASGMVQFIAGALLEFSAFGSFCEWATFDPATLDVTSPPVGWRLSGYDAGSRDGWDEFRGYYQGRQRAEAR